METDELSPNLGCDITGISKRFDQILVSLALFEGQLEHLECQIVTKKQQHSTESMDEFWPDLSMDTSWEKEWND